MNYFSTQKLSDEALVSLIRDGNESYFSVLVERYNSVILSKCRQMVKKEEVALDLSQEVLIKVFLQLRNFKSEARFSTWLYSIIYNTCIDYLRKDKKRQYQGITEKLIDEIADLVDDEELEEELSVSVLESLLELLSKEEKVILLLKYKDKHSIEDIQKALGLSQSAVKMRVKRAREHINILLKQSSK